MEKRNHSLKIIAGLFCAFLLLLPYTSYATDYLLTEEELATLESSLTELARINQQSQNELESLEKELAASKKSLETARKQSETLQNELTILRMASQNQETLLTAANASLEKSAAEAKATERRLKMERTAALGLCGILLYLLVK